jgi:hypothetical protein
MDHLMGQRTLTALALAGRLALAGTLALAGPLALATPQTQALDLSEPSPDISDGLITFGAQLIWGSGCTAWHQVLAIDARLQEGPIQTAQEMFLLLQADRTAWDCLRQMPGGWMSAVNADLPGGSTGTSSASNQLTLRKRLDIDYAPADQSAREKWWGPRWGQSFQLDGRSNRLRASLKWIRRPGESLSLNRGDLRGYLEYRWSGAVEGRFVLGSWTPRLGHGLVTWSVGAFDGLNQAVGVHRMQGGIRGTTAVGGAWARRGLAAEWGAGPSKWTAGVSLARRPMRTAVVDSAAAFDSTAPFDSTAEAEASAPGSPVLSWYADAPITTEAMQERSRRSVAEVFIDRRRSVNTSGGRLQWGAGARLWGVPDWHAGFVAGLRGAWVSQNLSARFGAAYFPKGFKAAVSAVLSLGRGTDFFARIERHDPADPALYLQWDGGAVPAFQQAGWSSRWGVEWRATRGPSGTGGTSGWAQWRWFRQAANAADSKAWAVGMAGGSGRFKLAMKPWELQGSVSSSRSLRPSGWLRFKARHDLEFGYVEGMGGLSWDEGDLGVAAAPTAPTAPGVFDSLGWMAGLRWTMKMPTLRLRIEGYSGGGNPDAPPKYVSGFAGTVGRALYGHDVLAALSVRYKPERSRTTLNIAWRYSGNAPRHALRIQLTVKLASKASR